MIRVGFFVGRVRRVVVSEIGEVDVSLPMSACSAPGGGAGGGGSGGYNEEVIRDKDTEVSPDSETIKMAAAAPTPSSPRIIVCRADRERSAIFVGFVMVRCLWL